MKFIYLFLTSILLSCTQSESNSIMESNRFEDFVIIDDISDVSVFNNKGKHDVVGEKRSELIQLLTKMTLQKNGSYKLGGKSIELTINGKKFTLIGRTNGDFIEVPKEIATKNMDQIEGMTVLYFKAENLTIDNY